jgi:integrase/recombinase XerD
MVVLHRRHVKACPHQSHKYTKCACPIWYDWRIGKRRIRKPIGTSDWRVAQELRKHLELEGPTANAAPFTIQEATDRFVEDATVSRGLQEPTIRKYKLLFRRMNEYFKNKGYVFLRQISPEDLREFRLTWKMSPRTASKHIERMKTFFKFALEFHWINVNPALPIRPPKVPPSESIPFTEEQLEILFTACDSYDGDGKRLEALMLLLLWTGLRIGDACTIGREKFAKDARGWKVELRTAKTGTDVSCVIAVEVAEAVLNQPGKYPFWTGESNAEDCASTWRKAFARLFTQAGIKGHIHQFRHTFAKRLLLEGASLEYVSQLLGHASIEVTQRHYNKWVRERQQDLEAVTRKIVVTYRSRGKIKPLEPA